MKKVIKYGRRFSSCYKCTRRTASCHATCKDYDGYTDEIAQDYAEQQTERALNQLEADRVHNAKKNQANARRRKYYREGRV